jgi:hypothetical protein
MSFLKRISAGFAKDERGTVVVETVLILPILLWALMALFSYWDVFRSLNVIQKAAYTVSDSISRTKKETVLEAADITGYYDLMNYLIDTDQEAKIRVTRYSYDLATNKYSVDWSCGVGTGMTPLTTAQLSLMTDRLPVMADKDFAILFESKVVFEPIFEAGAFFDLGLTTQDISEFVVTRPREGKFALESCPTVI